MSDSSGESGNEGSVPEAVAVAKRPAASHPPYLAMVLDAVQAQQTRSAGVSRPKIVQYLKSKYKLEEVNSVALKNAIKKGLEKDNIVSKTGSGMNGTFVLSKSEKLKVVKEEKKKERLEKKLEKEALAATEPKSPPKPKAKPKKVVKEKETKATGTGKAKATKTKKVVAAKATGKENKWKKGDPVRKPKILQAKAAALTSKANSGAAEDPQPSTSKQRAPAKGKSAK